MPENVSSFKLCDLKLYTFTVMDIGDPVGTLLARYDTSNKEIHFRTPISEE